MLLCTMPTLIISGGSSNRRLLGLNVPPPRVTPLSSSVRHSSGRSFAPASLSIAILRDCSRLCRRWLTDSYKFVEFTVSFFVATQVIPFWCGTACAAEPRCFCVIHLCLHVTSVSCPLRTYNVESAARYSWFPWSELSCFRSSHSMNHRQWSLILLTCSFPWHKICKKYDFVCFIGQI